MSDTPKPTVVIDATGRTLPRVDAEGRELGWSPLWGYVYFDAVSAPVRDYPYYEQRPQPSLARRIRDAD